MTIEFSIVPFFGRQGIKTASPYEGLGTFLSVSASRSDSWVFATLLPIMEELNVRGEPEKYTTDGDYWGVIVTPSTFTIEKRDVDSSPLEPPVSISLADGIELIKQWQAHLNRVQA